MSKSLTINAPQIVQTRNTLNAVPSGSTAESDYNVKYVPQTLTDEQKAQARQNIGAAAEGGGGQQVQANWNETDTTSPAYIQNKPTIPAAPVQSNWNESDTTSLAYIQNKPTIPAAQVQSDWNQTDDTAVDYIKNKPSLPEDEILLRKVNHTIVKTNTRDTVNVKSPTSSSAKIYKNGVRFTPSGTTITINNDYYRTYTYDFYVGSDPDNFKVELTGSGLNNAVVYIERWGGFQYYNLHNTTVPSGFTGKLITKIHNTPGGVVNDKNSQAQTSNQVTFYDYYLMYSGGNTIQLRGDLVFANVDVPTNTSSKTYVPNMEYCTGIYIHSSKVTAWKNWLTGMYAANTDLSSIFNKVIPYESITWNNDFDYKINLTSEIDGQIEQRCMLDKVDAIISSTDTDLTRWYTDDPLDIMWCNGKAANTDNHIEKGVNIFKLRYGLEAVHDAFNPVVKNADYTIIRNGINAMAGITTESGITGNVFFEIFHDDTTNASLTPYAYSTLPSNKLTILIRNNFLWDTCAYGAPTYYGKLIYTCERVPDPVESDQKFTNLPDVTNMDGIYVKNSVLDGFKTWITNSCATGVDPTALLAKVYGYDYLSDYHVSIPGDAPIPMTNSI